MPGCNNHSLVLDTHEAVLLSGLIPVLNPVSWADTERVLSVRLALVVISSSLLQADEPLIVTIPAVKRLVMGRETVVTGSGSGVLDLVQQVFLLFRKGWNLITENLVQLHFGLSNLKIGERCVSYTHRTQHTAHSTQPIIQHSFCLLF